MHADDLADACYLLLKEYNSGGFINIGSGSDISILDLAEMMKKVTNYSGDLVLNLNMPDGTYRKLMDSTKINELGFVPKIKLEEGISLIFNEYIKTH